MSNGKSKATPEHPIPGLIEMLFATIREDEVGHAPIRKHPSDAGLDLTCSRYISIYPGQKAQIPTNIRVAIPEGHFGLIIPRSSTMFVKGLHILPGLIDSGYRGEIMIVALNPAPPGPARNVHIGEGERLAQLIVLPKVEIEVIKVAESKLPSGERGTDGFGSTGGFESIRTARETTQ